MEILKVHTSSSNNIRIRTKSRSISKQRVPLTKIYPQTEFKRQKLTLSSIQNQTLFREIENEKNIRHSQSIKKPVFLTKNHQKRHLTLLTENIRKSEMNQMPQINMKINAKGKLIEQNSKQLSKDSDQINGLKTQRTQKKNNINIISCLKNSQKINQDQNYKNFQFNLEPNLNHGFQHQRRIDANLFKKNWMCIDRQFSITLPPQIGKTSVQVQTYASNVQDKYFHEYIKFRTMKGRSFKQIEEKQSIIKQLIKETINFTKNHQNLIKSIDLGPENQREKRVYCLAKDLLNQRQNIRQSFQKLKKDQIKFQQTIDKKVIPIKRRKYSLTQSILHLSQTLMFLNNDSTDSSSSKKKNRILERIRQQTNNLSNMDHIETNTITKIFSSYHQQISRLVQKFKNFESLLQENRTLLCNFIKQIQKIPVIMISLFGLGDTQKVEQWDQQTFLQTRYEEYLSASCEKCYYMDKKINLIKFHNSRIKPILKSLLWLVKTRDTEKCCLTMI